MAQAVEAPVGTMAEGPTQHTQKQAPERRLGSLSDLQIAQLLAPVNPDRVGEDGKGFSHMEAWDIRRHLIRIFGFGGHDIDLLDVTMIGEHSEMRRKRGKGGVEYGDPYKAWTVIYRVSMKLTVKVDGVELGHWAGVATGDATNQPSLADAHDLALKTADSQALKRAATNLGDQFGLSLYNKGSLKPVVQAALPYWKKPKEADFKDDKVEPEPEVVAAKRQAEDAGSEAVPDGPARNAASSSSTPPAGPGASSGDDPLPRLVAQYQDKNVWNNQLALLQIRIDGKQRGVSDRKVQCPPPSTEWTTFDALLETRIDELKAASGGNTEGNAA